jgi:hypothetical protein
MSFTLCSRCWLWFVGVNVLAVFRLSSSPLHLAFREVPARFRMIAPLETDRSFYSL